MLLDRAAVFPETLDCTDPPAIVFPGFKNASFSLLGRLQRNPHIEQYRAEKELIKASLIEPFRIYRDDLVVNLVLPNELPFETERNIFCRLLKNDFGKGGCHHHYWMSFYRHGLRRTTDLQLVHAIWPDHFKVMAFFGEHMQQRFQYARDLFVNRISEVQYELEKLPVDCQIRFAVREKGKIVWHNWAQESNADLRRIRRFSAGFSILKDEVIVSGPHLVDQAIHYVQTLWPLYLLFQE